MKPSKQVKRAWPRVGVSLKQWARENQGTHDISETIKKWLANKKA